MTQYYTDFSDSTPGAAPTSWVSTWDDAGLSWTYNAAGYIEAAGGNTGSDSGFLLWQTLGTGSLQRNIADAEILMKLQVLTERSSSTGVRHLGAIIRGNSASYSSANGYYAVLEGADAATDELNVYGRSSGSLVFYNNEVPKTWDLNTDYWLRYQIIGNDLKIKLWEDGTSEPGTWDIEVTDSAVTAQTNNSYVGIHWGWEASYRVYQFGVTDSPSTESAPAGPLGSSGTLAVTEGDDTPAFTGLIPFRATVAVSEEDDAPAFAGLIPFRATVAVSEEDDTVAFVGLMPWPEDIVLVTESITGQVNPYVADTLTVVETLIPPAMGVSSTDTVTLAETVTGQVNPRTLDTITLTETAGGALAITSAGADILTLTERTPVRVYGPASDVLTLTESALGFWVALSTDTVSVVETAAGRLAITQARSETVRVTDSAKGLVSVSVGDVVTVSESAPSKVRGFVAATDTVTVAETLGGVLLVKGAATDTITVVEVPAGRLAITAVGTDTVLVVETVGPNVAQRVLVVNADTGAVSTYSLPPTVQGLGEFNGTFYVAAEDGLYALDAADDGGTAVTWELRTGFSAMGSESLKSLEDLNAVLRASSDVQAMVVQARGGLKKEQHYKLTRLTRTATRDGVIPVGRGLIGTHWSFGLKGLNEAEIDEIRPNITIDSRRR